MSNNINAIYQNNRSIIITKHMRCNI